MEQHEGALGELVQRPEQRGPGLSHLPPYRYVHLLGGERRFRRIIGVRRGRRGGAGRGGSHSACWSCFFWCSGLPPWNFPRRLSGPACRFWFWAPYPFIMVSARPTRTKFIMPSFEMCHLFSAFYFFANLFLLFFEEISRNIPMSSFFLFSIHPSLRKGKDYRAFSESSSFSFFEENHS